MDSDNLKEIREDNEMAFKDEEPVVCSRCNIIFETDEIYLQHYDEVHETKSS